MPYRDPQDPRRAGASQRYYKRNRQAYLDRNAALRKRLWAWYLTLKEGKPCMDCGRHLPTYCMDFDHRPEETKSFKIAVGVQAMRSKQRILAEVAKCDLVCAVCHRIRTHDRLVAKGLDDEPVFDE